MEAPLKEKDPPDVAAEQRVSAELVKLIRKLRWVGMDNEAEQLETKLRRLPPVDSVVAGPDDTD